MSDGTAPSLQAWLQQCIAASKEQLLNDSDVGPTTEADGEDANTPIQSDLSRALSEILLRHADLTKEFVATLVKTNASARTFLKAWVSQSLPVASALLASLEGEAPSSELALSGDDGNSDADADSGCDDDAASSSGSDCAEEGDRTHEPVPLRNFSWHQEKVGYVPKKCVYCCCDLRFSGETTSAIRPNNLCFIDGLTSTQWLNGKMGTALRFVPSSSRWEILLEDGSTVAVSPQNLQSVTSTRDFPAGVVQCSHCSSNAFAFYCSEEHYFADFRRHAVAECAVMQRPDSCYRRDDFRRQVR